MLSPHETETSEAEAEQRDGRGLGDSVGAQLDFRDLNLLIAASEDARERYVDQLIPLPTPHGCSTPSPSYLKESFTPKKPKALNDTLKESEA